MAISLLLQEAQAPIEGERYTWREYLPQPSVVPST